MSAETENSLIEHFLPIGVDLKSKKDLLSICVELCVSFNLTAEDLLAKWESFTLNDEDACEMNAISLERLKKQIKAQALRVEKKYGKSKPSPHLPQRVAEQKENRSPVMFNIDSISKLSNGAPGSFETPRKRGAGENATPGSTKSRLTSAGKIASSSPFTPSSFDPRMRLGTQFPVTPFSKRTNSGSISSSFNESLPDPFGAARDTIKSNKSVEVAVLPQCQMESYKYMFQKLSTKAQVLDERIRKLSGRIVRKNGLEEASELAIPRQSKATYVGRICCDSEGKLNDRSVLLEGDLETSNGARVILDLSEMAAFSLFPGQIIAAEGINTTGDSILVQKLFQGVQLPYKTTRASEMVAYYSSSSGMDIDNENPEKVPLTVFAASGPYTLNADLEFLPLKDLLRAVEDGKPSVLLLNGPILDENNDIVSKGEVDVDLKGVLSQYVCQMLCDTLEKVPHLQIVIIPSVKDFFHDPVFPQSPLISSFYNLNHERITFLSNPCTFCINEVVFGVSSVDSLFDIGSQEISRSIPNAPKQDRLSRLCKHMLEQRSYYPLCPERCPIEYSKYSSIELPVTPDIMILSSTFNSFAKGVNGTVCINPGFLSKGQSGNTYARISVYPLRRNEIPTGDQPVAHNVPGRTRVDLVRV
eukprot:Nk52_evm15s223 gene=Nk52_evmTU15s223